VKTGSGPATVNTLNVRLPLSSSKRDGKDAQADRVEPGNLLEYLTHYGLRGQRLKGIFNVYKFCAF